MNEMAKIAAKPSGRLIAADLIENREAVLFVVKCSFRSETGKIRSQDQLAESLMCFDGEGESASDRRLKSCKLASFNKIQAAVFDSRPAVKRIPFHFVIRLRRSASLWFAES